MRKFIILTIALLILIMVGCSPTAEVGLTEDDLLFELDGKDYALFTDAAPLRDALGGGAQMSEAVSCMFEGMDRTYDFGDVIITTVPDGDVDLMDEIYILGGDYTTKKGLGIGSSKAELIETYGEKYIDDGYIITFPLDDIDDIYCPRLYFVYVDDVVVEFSLYDPTEVS